MRHDQVNPAATQSNRSQIIREPECARRTGLSRCLRWRLERAGKFPKRLRIGEVAHGWLASEVEAWIHDRAAERNSLDAARNTEAREHAAA